MESPFLDIPVQEIKSLNQGNNNEDEIMVKSPFVEPSFAMNEMLSQWETVSEQFLENINEDYIENMRELIFENDVSSYDKALTGDQLSTAVKLNTQYMKDDSLKWGKYLPQICELLKAATGIYVLSNASFTDMFMLSIAVDKYQDKKIQDKKLSVPKDRGVIGTGTWSEMQRDYHNLRNPHKININDAIRENKKEETKKDWEKNRADIIELLNKQKPPIIKPGFPLDRTNFALAVAMFQKSTGFAKVNGKLDLGTLNSLLSSPSKAVQIAPILKTDIIDIAKKIEDTGFNIYEARKSFMNEISKALHNLEDLIDLNIDISSAKANADSFFSEAFDIIIGLASAIVPFAEAKKIKEGAEKLIGGAELLKTVLGMRDAQEQSKGHISDSESKYTLAKLVQHIEKHFIFAKTKDEILAEIKKSLDDSILAKEQKLQELERLNTLATNIIHLADYPSYYQKIALASIIGHLAHTRLIVSCNNYFDNSLLAPVQISYPVAGISSYYISEWKKQDIELIGKVASLKIEFTNANATKLNLEEKDIGSNEEKILKNAWDVWQKEAKDEDYTLNDLWVKKDLFFRVYISRESESVAHDVFIRTLDITEKNWIPAKRVYRYNDKNPETIYFVPVWPDLKAFVQTYIRKHLVWFPVTKGITESNKNHLLYLDIIIGIVNAVMARDFGSLLSDKKISYIASENESPNKIERYENLPQNFGSSESSQYDYYFYNKENTLHELSSYETDFKEYEAEIEYDVPTVPSSSPAASPSCDLSIAVTQFDSYQVKKIDVDVLSQLKNKKAIEWNTIFLKKIKVDPQHVLTDLQRYVDLIVVKQTIEIYNTANPSAPIAFGTSPIDAVFAEAVHQFQKKIFFDTSLQNGNAGKNTLHSLGIISFLQNPEVNSYAKGQIEHLHIKLQLNGKDCNHTNWYNFTYNPSVFGIPFNRPVHHILIKQLRIAESYLFNLPRFRGDSLVDMGAKMGLSKSTEKHAGGRSGGTGMHTFGLAIDINHANNPFIGAGWIAVNSERTKMLEVLKKASGSKLYGSKIAQYLNYLGENKGADSYSVYDELKQRNDEFKTYLASHPNDLHYWQKSRTFQHGKASNGFLNLDRDLVYALRQVGNLAWGAIDFGAGDGGNGDIMHFDMRALEIGRKINREKSGKQGGDPLKTHLYLLKGGGELQELPSLNEVEDFSFDNEDEDFENWEEGEENDFEIENYLDDEGGLEISGEFEEVYQGEMEEDYESEGDETYQTESDEEYAIESAEEFEEEKNEEYSDDEFNKETQIDQKIKGYEDPNNSGNPLIRIDAKNKNQKLSENFTVKQFAHAGSHNWNYYRIDIDIIDQLQQLRNALGKPIKIEEGYYPPKYPIKNFKLNGLPQNNPHHSGRAVKISVQGMSGVELARQAMLICDVSTKIAAGERTASIYVNQNLPRISTYIKNNEKSHKAMLILGGALRLPVHTETRIIIEDEFSEKFAQYFSPENDIRVIKENFNKLKETLRTSIQSVSGKIKIPDMDFHEFSTLISKLKGLGEKVNVDSVRTLKSLIEYLKSDSSQMSFNAKLDFLGKSISFLDDLNKINTISERKKSYETFFNKNPLAAAYYGTDLFEAIVKTTLDTFRLGISIGLVITSDPGVQGNLFKMSESFGKIGTGITVALESINIIKEITKVVYCLVTGKEIDWVSTIKSISKSAAVIYLTLRLGTAFAGFYLAGIGLLFKGLLNTVEEWGKSKDAIAVAGTMTAFKEMNSEFRMITEVYLRAKSYHEKVAKLIGLDDNIENTNPNIYQKLKDYYRALGEGLSRFGTYIEALKVTRPKGTHNLYTSFPNIPQRILTEEAKKHISTLLGLIDYSKGFTFDLAYALNELYKIYYTGIVKCQFEIQAILIERGVSRDAISKETSNNEDIDTQNYNGDVLNEEAENNEWEEYHKVQAETISYPRYSQNLANGYLTLTGEKQGQIKGSIMQKGKEGLIAVYAYHHEITSPRDSATGMATGKRNHKPIVITKEVDLASTKLLAAMVSNERLKQVVINFWHPRTSGAGGGMGIETNYYRITLTNAFISYISQDKNVNPEMNATILEKIEFVYEKIEWHYLEGSNQVAADDWGRMNEAEFHEAIEEAAWEENEMTEEWEEQYEQQ
ncbi:hypothetical protein BH11BAC3_BH11BAC3_12860 [soil metagenome]